MAGGFIFFIVGLLPLSFIIAFCGLEVAIAFIQSQVFVVLTSSYIKDALELHGGSSSSSTSSETKVGSSPNLYPERKVGRVKILNHRKNYSTSTVTKISESGEGLTITDQKLHI